MPQINAYAAPSATSPLAPAVIQRREPGDHDIRIDIDFCGICHSDLHFARNEWGFSRYPAVPGHEIVGRVTGAGKKVTKFKVGDAAAIGCFTDSCRSCANCKAGLEQHCEKGARFTFGSVEADGKTPTYGGYSQHIVSDEAYALRIDAAQPRERVAPLLCAGITTYSPLKRFKAGKGSRVAVLGLGGLGHMAVKLAAAMGAEVTVLSSSKSKQADAKRLGAHDFALTSEAATAAKLARRFDILIDTVSAQHDLDPIVGFLRTGGTAVLVGAPPKPLSFTAFGLIGGRAAIAGSNIGGIAETQEMLDFCAKNKVLADVEVIPMASVNDAYERMLKSDVRYRFSIDMKTLG